MRTYVFLFFSFFVSSFLVAMQPKTHEGLTFYGLPVLGEKISLAAFFGKNGLNTGDVKEALKNIMPSENTVLKITKGWRTYNLDQKAIEYVCKRYQGLVVFAQMGDGETLKKAFDELTRNHWWLVGLYTKKLSSTRAIFKYSGGQEISVNYVKASSSGSRRKT